MEQFLEEYGYVALLIGTFLEGEMAMLVASSLAPTGLFELPGTLFFGFAGSFSSDWLYYLVGRINGKYFIARRPGLDARIRPVRKFFYTHKIQILFTYRFLYGFRIILPLIIGMSGIRPVQFLAYSLVSGILWASSVGVLGYTLGKLLNLKTSAFEENMGFIILGFAAFGLLLGYGMKRFASRHMHVPPDE